ncbi:MULTISPECIES: YolD-like family protein [unclassified Peribacillus]|uniref:YolD-like family protein n=1 Tax=unclassified Peribacillus TaxID=2675266 RepID=UPI001914770E|nr:MULTISPECIES: YolD-like family protein [unclassified Peribacillus]MBK5446137.1 YolD-like family protein [Peribacillus sp. TH24]MBK5497332.1 YolD-like family protein [Peribacillus sp. TH14]
MSIRDRGILKWQVALILPEHKAFQKQMNEDYFRQEKPILDDYQKEEYENQIHYSMENHLPIKFQLYNKRFPRELQGHSVYIYSINKLLHIQKKDNSFEYIQFDEVIGVIVED